MLSSGCCTRARKGGGGEKGWREAWSSAEGCATRSSWWREQHRSERDAELKIRGGRHVDLARMPQSSGGFVITGRPTMQGTDARESRRHHTSPPATRGASTWSS